MGQTIASIRPDASHKALQCYDSNLLPPEGDQSPSGTKYFNTDYVKRQQGHNTGETEKIKPSWRTIEHKDTTQNINVYLEYHFRNTTMHWIFQQLL